METNVATIRARFEQSIRKTKGGHWTWTGSRHTLGHPVLSIMGKQRPASRVSWVLHHGPIPEGHGVYRTCGQRDCVNPDHLCVSDVAPRAA